MQVVSYEDYFGCMSCKVKVSDMIGQCGKCGMKQKFSGCSKSYVAQFVIEDEKEGKMKVYAFKKVVGSIESGTSIDIKLLSVPKKKFIMNTAVYASRKGINLQDIQCYSSCFSNHQFFLHFTLLV